MNERFWIVSFTLPMIGLELFVCDPDAPLTMLIPESQVKSRVVALNTLSTTTIIDIHPQPLGES